MFTKHKTEQHTLNWLGFFFWKGNLNEFTQLQITDFIAVLFFWKGDLIGIYIVLDL